MSGKDRGEDLMKDFLRSNEVTYQQILNTLLEGGKNISLKSDIPYPQKLAVLDVLRVMLKKLGWEKSAGSLKTFTKKYLEYRISKNRASRTEVVNALSGMNRKGDVNLSIGDKLTKNLKDL